jgi:2-oxoglutarate dehydrogenase E2 component (dihydrolipoamide succinyltransferase)
MSADIKVPTMGESVTSATVARWLKQPGDAVRADEAVVELETDKVSVEVNAPEAGTLGPHEVGEGEEVEVGALLTTLDDGGTAAAPPPSAERKAGAGVNPPPPPSGPVARPATRQTDAHAPMPAAVRLMTENNVKAADVGEGTGKDGRVTKGDVLDFLDRPAAPAPGKTAPSAPRRDDPREQRVKMTRLRQTIARRLKEAQANAAMLTTFNEVDMSAVMTLRSQYKEQFEKKHGGARLGFMSFFVRACVAGLAEFPAVNAEIDGDEIVYRNFVNMGIAVGGPNGLVVPVLRDAETMGFAEIERRIADFGKRARDGALKIDELSGGTFSITNGGIYGSLMSTPILNAPQSAILGMHKIQDRPVAIAGKVEIRPMMYLALSYDHRIIDGKEAVSFLVRVKEGIEDPRRLLLGL